MKNLILYCLLIFPMSNAFSQISSSQQVLDDNLDSIYVYQTADFSLGSGDTCPKLQFSSLTEVEDTTVLELYYDINGIWPTLFCTSYDTISIAKSDLNNCDLKIITISHFDDIENPIDTLFSDTLNLFEVCQFTSINDISSESDFEFFPNPVYRTFKIKHENARSIIGIELFGFDGKLKRGFDYNENERYNLEDLPSAPYVIKIITDKGIYSKLLLKI